MKHIKHLLKDKRLKPAIKKVGNLKLVKRENVYFMLISSIISQQLSTKVADVFKMRLLGLYGGKIPTPEQILSTPFEKLRSIGLSNAKANYILNVARFTVEEGMSYEKLNAMSNDEVIEYLTQIKGVGRWTVEMLLMFVLSREDIFAVNDLGIRSAMIKLYGLRTKDEKKLTKRLHEISKAWSPYRTYACMYLWRYKDGK
jgi:DNA-3-methyladenine glycosylase II